MKVLLKPELLCLLLLVAGTWFGAWWLSWSGYAENLPRTDNPERDIVDPPVALPPISAATGGGRHVDNVWSVDQLWTLVYARTTPCDQQCFRDLIRLVQVYRSLGSDQKRVQRLYLSPGPAPKVMQDESILVGRLDRGHGGELLARLNEAGLPPGPDGRVYFVDPNGWLVLGYPPSPDREGLHDDLERLLNN